MGGKDIQSNIFRITDRGVDIPVSTFDGISYKDYRSTYQYIGTTDNPSSADQTTMPEPIFPDLSGLSGTGATLRVIYSDNISATTVQNYYPESYENVQQYLGKVNFQRSGYYLAGWALAENPNEIVFSTYQQFDYALVERMKSLSSEWTDAVYLYAVWIPDSMGVCSLPIQTVTEAEISGSLSGYFSEDDLKVQYAYVDASGDTQYTIEDSDITYNYNRNELYKAILAMATVATENDYEHPNAYIAYCEKILENSITNYKGCSISYTAKTMPGTRKTVNGVSWTANGKTYYADGARLCATVTVYVNPSVESFMETDPTDHDWFAAHGFPENKFWEDGWTEDNKDIVRNYVGMEYSEFIEVFQIVLPAQSSYMTGDDGYAIVYNQLISYGYSPGAALGILGNLAVESGNNGDSDLNPQKVSGSDTKFGIAQISLDRINGYAETVGESWPNVSISTQTGMIVKDLSDGAYWGTAVTGSGTPATDTYISAFKESYYKVSSQAYKQIMDYRQAVVAFCSMYEGRDYKTAQVSVRIEAAEKLAHRIVYGDTGNYNYVNWALNIADDNTHGYSQARRNGNPDYDCSSLIAYSLKENGYSINSIFSTYNEGYVLKTVGFTEMSFISTDLLQAGDILWRTGHTAIYIGNNQIVHAIDDYDGKPGDSSGNEIAVTACSNNWSKVYRPPASASGNVALGVNGQLLSMHSITYYGAGADENGAGNAGKNASSRYNGGLLSDGQVAVKTGTLPLGTVIYIVTQPTGDGSFSNGKYYIVTDHKPGAPESVDVFHDVKNASDNNHAPYGKYTQAKIYKVAENVTWDQYMLDYYNKR